MVRYLIISFIGGILFGILDGVINANPLAQRLYQAYKPITRASLNLPAGILIDLLYGFVLAGAFLLLYQSLPGSMGLAKGISYAFLIWFFRSVMYVASHWMMFNVPAGTLLYTLLTGLGEMLVLGMLYGLMLKPTG